MGVVLVSVCVCVVCRGISGELQWRGMGVVHSPGSWMQMSVNSFSGLVGGDGGGVCV